MKAEPKKLRVRKNKKIEYCKCACGQLVELGTAYALGHNVVGGVVYCLCGCGSLVKERGHVYLAGHNGKWKTKSVEEINRRTETRKRNREFGKPIRESKICECGECGLMTNPGCRFINGHNGRGNKWPEIRKQKMSELFSGEGNPRYGHPCHPNTLAAAKAQRGENHPCFGKKHTKEQRLANSLRVKKAYADGRLVPNNRNEGIGGVFNGKKFDSTPELSFLLKMIKIMSRFVRADSNQDFRIDYKKVDSGTWHSYFPDYFDPDVNVLYEIKQNGYEDRVEMKKDVDNKKPYAVNHCEKYGWVYELVSSPKLSKKKVVFPMREKYEVQLDNKWECQYWNWIFENPLNF